MGTRIIQYFWNSTGALFAAAAVALLIGIHASTGLELPHDSLFYIPLRSVYWIFSGLALSMALVCLFSHKTSFKAALILWMMLNAVVYALGVQWNGSKGDFSAYLSCVADAFGITPTTTFWLAKAICLYLLIGSGAVLVFGKKFTALEPKADQSQLATKMVPALRRAEVLVRTLKISCTACGGHIEFPTNFFGERIPCPHCKATITLQKSKNLKMSCTACNGHIEFPDYAIGKRISCPHCKTDIPLKESA